MIDIFANGENLGEKLEANGAHIKGFAKRIEECTSAFVKKLEEGISKSSIDSARDRKRSEKNAESSAVNSAASAKVKGCSPLAVGYLVTHADYPGVLVGIVTKCNWETMGRVTVFWRMYNCYKLVEIKKLKKITNV